jgi:hypothetical protein
MCRGNPTEAKTSRFNRGELLRRGHAASDEARATRGEGFHCLAHQPSCDRLIAPLHMQYPAIEAGGTGFELGDRMTRRLTIHMERQADRNREIARHVQKPLPVVSFHDLHQALLTAWHAQFRVGFHQLDVEVVGPMEA